MKAARNVPVPRLASTLVLLANSKDLGYGADRISPFLRRGALAPNDIHVLMARRHSKARFMPEMYVFPGGGVDKEDGEAAVAEGFVADAAVVGSSAAAAAVGTAWSSRIAALRELVEETSCVLRANDTIESAATWQQSAAGQQSQRIYDAQAAPLLTPLGRWITPEDHKYRYDTYFYGAALKPSRDQNGLPPQLVELENQAREISELVWVSPLEALVRHETPTEAFSLPQPTFHLLAALARMPSFASIEALWRGSRRTGEEARVPQEAAFEAVIPQQNDNETGTGFTFPQMPLQFFHNIGAAGVLERGHYSVPSGTTADGKETYYADVFVGGATQADTPTLISHIRN